MKKGKNTYVLLAAVLLIWAIVGYKIYASLKGNEVLVMTNSNIKPFEGNIENEELSFSISDDYRDPFFRPKKKKRPKKIIKKAIVFPRIVYKGMTESGGKATYFVNINRKSYLFDKNKSFDGVKLLKGNKKEIVILFENTKKTISI